MEDRHPIRQIVLLLTLAGIMAWIEMPDWQRRMVIARLRSRTRAALAWMARRSGHRAMGDELSGHGEAADAGYGFTFRLSQLRDRI